MSSVILEVCCGSADDVIQAHKAGAHRVELNSNLFHGGLTPTIGELVVAKRETGMKIMTMVRPREGGFCYTEAEFATALEDAKQLLANGSDGLVFGFLHQDGTLDLERTRILAEMAQEAGKETVFHRAIDVVPDWKSVLDALIELKITRVLTSGQEEKAVQGAYLLGKLQAKYGDRIQILAGSGVNAANAGDLMERTGLTQVHSSCKGWRRDETTTGERVHYRFAPDPHGDDYDVVSEELVRRLVESAG